MGQVGKLGYVDAKLGASFPGQQTTRIVYDTLKNQSGSNLDFFKSFQNKTIAQTNLTTNKLDSSESMVIKSIWLLQTSAQFDEDLPEVIPFGSGNAIDRSAPQVLSILVGNQKVVKNLPIHYNSNGESFDRLHAFDGGAVDFGVGPTTLPAGAYIQRACATEIRLLTDIVIPPQVSFSVQIESAENYLPTANYVCALAGYGRIFSAGSSF